MQDLQEIFGADGPLARVLDEFAPRRSQWRMAERVAACLDERGRLLVEAGTGTGKTFAYLVPALLSGLRVILSTGTRTLQDQLFHRDLPLLAGALGRGARIALLKGRTNYLCRERLLRSQSDLPLDAAGGRLMARLQLWSLRTQTGDLAEVPELSDSHPVRARVTSTRDSCSGSRCAEFSRCHVFVARRAAAEADIVVVNHHLLMADLTLKEEGFGDILPSADAVVLDEAHQLPDLAAQFFGTSFASRQVELLQQDVRSALQAAGLTAQRLAAADASLQAGLLAAGVLVRALTGTQPRIAWEHDTAGLDNQLAELSKELADYAAKIRDLDGGEQLGNCAERALQLRAALDTVSMAGADEGARTLEAGSRGYSLQLLPFDVGPRFRSIVDARRCAWVFTSATLSVGEDFTHFSSRLGLGEEAATLRIESPFDYERQSLLFLPPAMPDPASPGYAEAVTQLALPLLEASQGGAFLLFTSHRALERTAVLLRAHVHAAGAAAPLRLLVQGDSPRELLLQEFRRSEHAVLLGTASFWEGVDVKGPALRLVIIDKLPFASPDDPLTRARVEHIRSSGGNPFRDYQLPEAALALKQGVGRLIRSEQDEGVVVICDPRLTTRSYGRNLLASLPPLRVSREHAEVSRFLRRLRPAAVRTVAVPEVDV
ncbi:MAG TPA: ATP-dependent DNA helicase [Steroidobacteraceae bacterium]|jgi:ATP-dependent DNA helicase DinG|nr:ATP-dependent DNA helicase [Steroidobacteraceae bacterium]